MPTVKNISNKNIIIFNKILDPGKSVKINQDQLDEISHLIENKQLKVEVATVNRTKSTITNLDETNNNKYLEVKEKLLPAFFALHLNQNLSNEQLQDIKWFFKNVGPTSQLDYDLKVLIDDIQSEEELLEILLNHLYPELIKNHFKNN